MTATPMLRTADDRFTGLPDFDFAPHTIDDLRAADGARVHYLDEGPRGAKVTALCLHGNPTWCYVYRKMMPVFAQSGLRVVAPDMVGFGRSDKPQHETWHRFDRHRDVLLEFVERLELSNILLVCQDWGGLLGLTLPMAQAARFTRLLVMNTALGTGAVSEGFRQWRTYSNAQPDLAVGRLIARGKPDMSAGEAAAYDAPFPEASFKAALRAFPNMVPDGDDAPGAAISRQAAAYLKQQWRGESFMAIGMQDPVLGAPVMHALRKTIRGCPPPVELPEAGHFVQEWGAPVAQAALARFRLGT